MSKPEDHAVNEPQKLYLIVWVGRDRRPDLTEEFVTHGDPVAGFSWYLDPEAAAEQARKMNAQLTNRGHRVAEVTRIDGDRARLTDRHDIYLIRSTQPGIGMGQTLVGWASSEGLAGGYIRQVLLECLEVHNRTLRQRNRQAMRRYMDTLTGYLMTGGTDVGKPVPEPPSMVSMLTEDEYSALDPSLVENRSVRYSLMRIGPGAEPVQPLRTP